MGEDTKHEEGEAKGYMQVLQRLPLPKTTPIKMM